MPLAVVVSLTINAFAKPRFGEEALVYLALLAQNDFRFENIDLASHRFRQFPGKLFLP